MNGREHYAAAEKLLTLAHREMEAMDPYGADVSTELAAAQVHATLALADAALPQLITYPTQ